MPFFLIYIKYNTNMDIRAGRAAVFPLVLITAFQFITCISYGYQNLCTVCDYATSTPYNPSPSPT